MTRTIPANRDPSWWYSAPTGRRPTCRTRRSPHASAIDLATGKTLFLTRWVTYSFAPSGVIPMPRVDTHRREEQRLASGEIDRRSVGDLLVRHVGRLPSGLSTTSSGSRFAGIVRVILPARHVHDTEGVVLPQGHVHCSLVGAQRHAARALAHRMVATTALVRGETTAMVLGISLLTYSRGSREPRERTREDEECGKGRCAPPGGSSRSMERSRSVVEDCLVDMQRLVEPADTVAPADALEDRPGQIGARYVGIREIGHRSGPTGRAAPCAGSRPSSRRR